MARLGNLPPGAQVRWGVWVPALRTQQGESSLPAAAAVTLNRPSGWGGRPLLVLRRRGLLLLMVKTERDMKLTQRRETRMYGSSSQPVMSLCYMRIQLFKFWVKVFCFNVNNYTFLSKLGLKQNQLKLIFQCFYKLRISTWFLNNHFDFFSLCFLKFCLLVFFYLKLWFNVRIFDFL